MKHWQWQSEDIAGQAGETAASREKFFPRAVKIPASRLAAPQENLEDLPKCEGLVVGLFPGGATVDAPQGRLLCGVAKTFRAPEGSSALAVGDGVTVALINVADASGAKDDKDRADGMILSRQPRRTALSRPEPTSGKHRDVHQYETFEKVIVANMDVLLVVAASRQPPLRHGLIDRFLIIAERGELTPILAINKIDLGEPDAQIVEEFAALGMKIYLCSAATGEGIAPLAAALAGKRSVLAGPSGVGKSTLVNAIIPEAGALTREVRSKDERGRHTTSAASIYALPGGGVLVDTPGIREMGIRIEPAVLPWYFPEFEPFSPQCAFRDCSHTHEPNCGVRSAVEEGKILPRRYESYLRILETLED